MTDDARAQLRAAFDRTVEYIRTAMKPQNVAAACCETAYERAHRSGLQHGLNAVIAEFAKAGCEYPASLVDPAGVTHSEAEQQIASVQEFPCGHLQRKIRRSDGSFQDHQRCGICWLREQIHDLHRSDLAAAEQQIADLTRERDEWKAVVEGARRKRDMAERRIDELLQRLAVLEALEKLYENAQCVTCAAHLDAALTRKGEAREEEIRKQALYEAQRAVVEACTMCDGQGWTIGIETGSGHACDGTDESCAQNCPVPVPVQVQEQCEYCGRPSAAILALLAPSSPADKEQPQEEHDPLCSEGVLAGDQTMPCDCYLSRRGLTGETPAPPPKDAAESPAPQELREALIELQSAAWSRSWKRVKVARARVKALVGFDVPGPLTALHDSPAPGGTDRSPRGSGEEKGEQP